MNKRNCQDERCPKNFPRGNRPAKSSVSNQRVRPKLPAPPSSYGARVSRFKFTSDGHPQQEPVSSAPLSTWRIPFPTETTARAFECKTGCLNVDARRGAKETAGNGGKDAATDGAGRGGGAVRRAHLAAFSISHDTLLSTSAARRRENGKYSRCLPGCFMKFNKYEMNLPSSWFTSCNRDT